jgi:hypothetical protein
MAGKPQREKMSKGATSLEIKKEAGGRAYISPVSQRLES